MVQAAPLSGEVVRQQATERMFNAVSANDYAAVQASIGAGADVDARNAWGLTAADLAVDKGYFQIAHYLVSVRNVQLTKAEQTAAVAPTTQVGGKTGAESAAPPSEQHETQPTASTVKRSPLAAAALPASTPLTAAAGSPTAAPALETTLAPGSTLASGAVWHSDDGPNPFDPQTPAYGAKEQPVESN